MLVFWFCQLLAYLLTRRGDAEFNLDINYKQYTFRDPCIIAAYKVSAEQLIEESLLMKDCMDACCSNWTTPADIDDIQTPDPETKFKPSAKRILCS